MHVPVYEGTAQHDEGATRRLTKPAKEANFLSLTVQLNRNYSARLHVDKSNHGLPCIIAIGEYPDGRHSYYTLDQATDLHSSIPMGRVFLNEI